MPRSSPSAVEIEGTAYNDAGLLVVDFHEQSNLTIGHFDGTPAERDANLHNHNVWEVSKDRLTSRGGEELRPGATIDGHPLSRHPWGGV